MQLMENIELCEEFTTCSLLVSKMKLLVCHSNLQLKDNFSKIRFCFFKTVSLTLGYTDLWGFLDTVMRVWEYFFPLEDVYILSSLGNSHVAVENHVHKGS